MKVTSLRDRCIEVFPSSFGAEPSSQPSSPLQTIKTIGIYAAAATLSGVGMYAAARRKSEKAAFIGSGALGIVTIGVAISWRRAVAKERECKARKELCFFESLDADLKRYFFGLSAILTAGAIIGTTVAYVRHRRR
jgi:hypothetical protein